MAEMKNLKVEVVRYNPEVDTAPHSAFYDVPYDEQTSLLDALGFIKDNGARPELPLVLPNGNLRFLRHDGQQGAEAGLQNLPARLHQRHQGGGIGQLPDRARSGGGHDPLYRKPEAIKPYIIGNNRTPDRGPNKQTPAQMAKYHQFSGCINCGLCYAACPQFGLNPEFIGPAAITLAHRYNEDSRDHGKKERMAQLNGQNGVWTCTFVGYCSEVCPKHVDPAAAIQQGKVESSKDFLIATLKPR